MASAVHAGDYSTWARYRPVTLNTSQLGMTAAVANVPILLRFKASAHKDMLDSAATQVQANGSDIRVTKADGTTDVPFEIEHLTTGPEGRLHIWILADNVAANNAAAGSYRVFWGKTGQTSMSSPAAVFPTSAGYQAVFHLNDTSLTTVVNSANNALNGTVMGTSVITSQPAGNGFVSAKAGGVVRTFGTDANGVGNDVETPNYIRINQGPSHVLSTHNGPLTIEAWIYSSIVNSGNTSAGTKHIVAHGEGNTGGKAWFARTASEDGANGQNHYSAGGPNNINGPIAPFGEQHHWQFVTAVYNGTNWTIYRNRENDFWNNPAVSGPSGMLPDSAFYKVLPPSTAPTASTMPWYIGGASNATGDTITRGWQGWMDEVRISTVARDSNYVKLTFYTSRADTLNNVTHPVSVGPTEIQTQGGAYALWSGHRSITLNTTPSGANVAANVTNFPVLIRLGTNEASILSAAKADGSDIRFSKADDMTALPYEIESWSPTAAAIWVKVDTVKGNNSTQTIRMHWGNNAATSQSNGAAVFDTANNIVSVWHMNGTTTETSSTAHAFVATAPNDSMPTVLAASAIGGGRRFSGTQYMRAIGSAGSAMSFAAESTYTLSAWVRADSTVPTGTNTGHAIITKGDHQYALALFNSAATANRWYEITTKINGWRQTTTDTAGSYTGAYASNFRGIWKHVTGTWNGSPAATATGRIYLDGVLQKTTVFNTTTGNGARQTARDVHIGVLSNLGTNSTAATGTLQRFFVGALDELRIERGVRDSNWIRLSFQNQKESNSLVNIGLPVFTAPGAPTNVVATPDTVRATVTWQAPANNGGKPVLSYKAMVVGDTAVFCESTTLSCRIDLSVGVAYNIVVRAINEIGGGPTSNASNSVTPIAPIVPTAPLNPTAAAVSGSSDVLVSWTAPAYNGGAPITSYTVTSNPGGITCLNTGELTCQVAGLTGGVAYTFTVTASNITGAGPASAATASVTTSLAVPRAFAIHMVGTGNPYTYRLPTASIASTEKLTMTITDIKGRTVWSRTINPSSSKAGEITWDGLSSKGQAVSAGMYIVRLRAVLTGGQVVEAMQRGLKD